MRTAHRRSAGMKTSAAIFMISTAVLAAPAVAYADAPDAQIDGEAASDPQNWLEAFYHERGLKPVWTHSSQNERRLSAYLDILAEAGRFGLDREAYRYSALKKAVKQDKKADRNAIELTASQSLAAFALDIRDGVINPRIDYTEETLAARKISQQEILEQFLDAKSPESFFVTLRQDNPVQAQLTRALNIYEKYLETGGFTKVSLTTDVVELGDSGPDITAIAKRLREEGFFTGAVAATESDTPQPLYDDRLAAAVEAFQTSRGIEPDGVIGPETLSRMNESVETLVASIKLNMERARWLPQDFADRHILVNIAGYNVGLYENERLKDQMRVIVGKDHHQTPVFAGSMSYVVVNPFWNIPSSIVYGEIAPKMADDPNYLASKNMEVLSGWSSDAEVIDPQTVDWDDLPSPLGFRVRQKAGPTNALGYVKFMFPNEYSVYLHDTPADSLFSRTERAFSHGCIRLEKPRKMAEWVFKNGTTEELDIDALIESGERTQIDLKTEIPVYITYFTAWAEKDGGVYFFPDVYERDSKLEAALEQVRLSGDATKIFVK